MGHRHVDVGGGLDVPLSAAVVAGDTCYLSGAVAVDPESGELRRASAAEQTRLAAANLLRAAAAAGFAASELVYVQLLLTDIDRFAEVNAAYEEALGGPPFPARMTYAVAALPLGASVEIQGIAVRA